MGLFLCSCSLTKEKTLSFLDTRIVRFHYEDKNGNFKITRQSGQEKKTDRIVTKQQLEILDGDKDKILEQAIVISNPGSIKNKNAYALSSVITGMSRYTARYAAPDLTSPMLFYSRPKGEYSGLETDAVLLDFYIVNCDLSNEGYRVKAEINGTEFMLKKWCGYFMEGLPMGENTVKLTLIDAKGKQVESPYAVSERKFVLKK